MNAENFIMKISVHAPFPRGIFLLLKMQICATLRKNLQLETQHEDHYRTV